MNYLYKSLCVALLVLPHPLFAQSPPAQSLPAGGSTPANASPRLEVIGLRLIQKLPEADKYLGFGLDEAGTQIDFLVSCPGRAIIGYDKGRSKATAFQDDVGTDLARSEKSDNGSLDDWDWVHWFNASNDKHEAAFSVGVPDLPAPEATTLQLKATLVLLLGSALTTKVYPNVLFKEGTLLMVGSLRLRVSDREDAKKPETGMNFTLSSHEQLEPIRTITFLSPGGTEIQSALRYSGSIGGEGNVAYYATFTLPRKVSRATLKITYYARVESAPVAIDTKASIGLR